MKSLIVIVTLFFVFMIGACSDGKPGKLAKESYVALKKVEAKTEAGVNYREYAQAVGDAKFAINMFNESKERIENKNITDSINQIMEYYLLVGEVWTHNIKKEGGSLPILIAGYPGEGDLYNKVIKIYPKIKIHESGSAQALSVNDVMHTLWKQSSIELKYISKLFE